MHAPSSPSKDQNRKIEIYGDRKHRNFKKDCRKGENMYISLVHLLLHHAFPGAQQQQSYIFVMLSSFHCAFTNIMILIIPTEAQRAPKTLPQSRHLFQLRLGTETQNNCEF